jgi:hypothetical protein
MKPCAYENCQKAYYAKGLCEMHWRRVRKHGTPDGGETNHAPSEERFWRGVDRKGADECWLYVRGARRGKYGLFQSGGKGSPHVGAHRYSYEIHKGPIPEGLLVMHSCDVPRCVNPAHLSVGTYKQNAADMIAKGRHSRIAPLGSQNGKSKLNEELALMIKCSSETNAQLSRKLGLSPTTIRGVRIGRTWKHVN